MKQNDISRATIGRIPVYLKYLKTLPENEETISATVLAKGLGLGEVQVRKDLGALSGAGKPKIGYRTADLIGSLEEVLCCDGQSGAVIVGAGKLGRALLDYDGFSEYGLKILAAFDCKVEKPAKSDAGKDIFPMDALDDFCRSGEAKIGIITVPAASAQAVCDRLIKNQIRAIWSFAPCLLQVPAEIPVQYENMALSLAHLKIKYKTLRGNEPNT